MKVKIMIFPEKKSDEIENALCFNTKPYLNFVSMTVISVSNSLF